MGNKKVLMIVIGIVLLLAIGAGIYFSKGTPQYTVQSGYTSLAISNVEILDSGARIRIFGTANGAEAVNVYFDPIKINNYINDDGYTATKPAYMTISMSDPSREFYVTKNTNKNFIKLSTFSLTILKSCKNNVPEGGVNVGRVNALSGTCIYGMPIGTYSTFSGQAIDNTPVNFNIEGTTGTLKPSSGVNVLTLSDGKTKVEWTGNLLNYNNLNTPSSYAVLFFNSQFTKMIDVGSYSSYETAINTYGDCMGQRFLSSSLGSGILDLVFGVTLDSQATSCINDFNNKLNTILTDKTNSYKSSVSIDGLDFTNNGVKVHLTTPSVFPTFIITLDASKVGIVELKGKPDIVSCVADNTIRSGDTYSTSVQVQNTGSNDGSFYGQLSCSGSSGVSGVISEQFVKKGETATLPIQVSGTNTISGIQNNNCQVKVIDRKSQDADTCNFKLGVEYQQNIVCSPNSITCKDSKTLKKCNNAGTGFDLETCDNGCAVLESGEAQCRDQSKEICIDNLDNDGDGLIDKDDPDCKEEICKGHWYALWLDGLWCKVNILLAKLKYATAIILGLLGGLLMGSLTYKFLPNDSKKKWIIFGVVTVVTGVIIGFIAFTYFWYILLALIILGLVKAFVPVL